MLDAMLKKNATYIRGTVTEVLKLSFFFFRTLAAAFWMLGWGKGFTSISPAISKRRFLRPETFRPQSPTHNHTDVGAVARCDAMVPVQRQFLQQVLQELPLHVAQEPWHRIGRWRRRRYDCVLDCVDENRPSQLVLSDPKKT